VPTRNWAGVGLRIGFEVSERKAESATQTSEYNIHCLLPRSGDIQLSFTTLKPAVLRTTFAGHSISHVASSLILPVPMVGEERPQCSNQAPLKRPISASVRATI
jgi:hypothetical protein